LLESEQDTTTDSAESKAIGRIWLEVLEWIDLRDCHHYTRHQEQREQCMTQGQQLAQEQVRHPIDAYGLDRSYLVWISHVDKIGRKVGKAQRFGAILGALVAMQGGQNGH